jgi:hypothetical protein
MEDVKTIITLLGDLATFFWLSLRPQSALAAENLFLRKQLAMYRDCSNSGSGFRPERYESICPNPRERNRAVINAGRHLFATMRPPFWPVTFVLS